MKTWTIAKWSLGLALVTLPLADGYARESVVPTQTMVSAPESNLVAAAEDHAPEAEEPDLENAAAKLVTPPQAATQAANLTPTSAEIARLAQSGLDESVMLAFVNGSTSAFNLDAEQIIYLNDIGVPGNVVTAMIQHDQVFKAALPASAPAPVAAYQPAPVESNAVVEAAPAQPQVEVTTTDFYDELSPYGSWIEVEGYGRCWQPTVVVADRNWTPYCDRGRWVYSDCGWYWASDYSWGWAPFHYGRWFRHGFWGWCWAPDTVWGPSWVSWRYNSGYCGWAPLPPAARYHHGSGFSYHGRSVGISFGFGLGADCFTFVAVDRFCDPQPFRHRVPRHDVPQIFNHTTIINPVVEVRGNGRFHSGIPSRHIADVTHREIKPVIIHETTGRAGNRRGEQLDRNQGTLTVFRPHLQGAPAQPGGNRAGEGFNPASPRNDIRRDGSVRGIHNEMPQRSPGVDGAARTPVPPTVVPGRIETSPGQVPGPVRGTLPVGNNPPRRLHNANGVVEVNSGIPRNVPVVRGHSDAARPPVPDQSRVVVNPATPPVRNSLLNNRQPQVHDPARVIETPVPAQRPIVRHEQPWVRLETPRQQLPPERVSAPPVAPVQRPVETHRFQAPAQPVSTPQSVMPRNSFHPPVERAVSTRPVVPATPRLEAPKAQAAQTPPAHAGGGTRPENRQDGRNSRPNH